VRDEVRTKGQECACASDAVGGKQFASTLLVNLGIQACTILQGVLLARLLGPEGRGQFAGAMLWPSVFAGVGGLGLGVTLARRAAVAEDLRPLFRSAIVLGIGTGLLATAACAASLPWLLATVDQQTRIASWVFIPFITFNHVALAVLSVDHGAGRFAQYNRTRFVVNPLYLALIGLLWLKGEASVVWYIICLAAANGVVAGIRVVTALRYSNGWGPILPLSRVFREAAPFAVSGLFTPLLTVADKALLLYLLGEEQLGLYAVALTAASTLSVVSQAGGALSFTVTAQENSPAAFDRVSNVFRTSAWIWLIGGLALATAMPVLVPLVYGNDFHASVAPAIALIGAAAFAGQATVLENSMRGQGRAFVGVESRVVGMLSFLLLGIWAVPSWGLIGAAGAYVFGQCIVLAVMVNRTTRLWPDVTASLLIPRREDLHQLFKQIYWRLRRRGPRSATTHGCATPPQRSIYDAD
jgi:antigen flippase